ncbi:MAG: 30S ribosomal protein S9 [Patescibacteria group bacterium]|jgi:small subunit ribosomal protein S9
MATVKNFKTGTGRRKTSTARVFLYEKGGDFLVNGKAIEEYFPSEKEALAWQKPFHLIGVSHPQAKFTVTAKILGSGHVSQLGALVHGISRALSEISEENRLILRKSGLLTRDSRMVERKKPYLRKARKAPQYSKR